MASTYIRLLTPLMVLYQKTQRHNVRMELTALVCIGAEPAVLTAVFRSGYPEGVSENVRRKGASVDVFSRIAALPLWAKVALCVIALLVSVILSPLTVIVALFVLIIAIVALIFRALRRRPLKCTRRSSRL
jgi:hypothetical protein